MSLLDKLRASRKHPSVLKLKVLKVRGEDPSILIFIYEGLDDIPVYEEWMKRIENCPRYEPIAGAGKQQLLAYYQQLSETADPLLGKIFFFVDRDFDLPLPASDRVFELAAYSVENLICTEDVVESLLKDEFRRAGAPAERQRIRAKFNELRERFFEICKSLHFLLFAAERSGGRVIRKPEKVTEIVQVHVDSISPAFAELSEILEVTELPAADQLESLRTEYHALPKVVQERGKYLLEMFRRWLRMLTQDLKSPEPVLFDSQDERLPGDPSAVSMRRLASSTPIPANLPEFVAAAAAAA